MVNLPALFSKSPVNVCVCCGTELRSGQSRHHPFWSNQPLCLSCVSEVPRCLGCERKRMHYVVRDNRGCVKKSVAPLGLEHNQTICGACNFAGLMDDPKELRYSTRRVVVFLARYLDTYFDDGMLSFQRDRFSSASPHRSFPDFTSTPSDYKLPPVNYSGSQYLPPVKLVDLPHRNRMQTCAIPSAAAALNSDAGRYHPGIVGSAYSVVYNKPQYQTGSTPAPSLGRYPAVGEYPVVTRSMYHVQQLEDYNYHRGSWGVTIEPIAKRSSVDDSKLRRLRRRSTTVYFDEDLNCSYQAAKGEWYLSGRPEVSWITSGLSPTNLEAWNRYANKVCAVLPSGFLAPLGADRREGNNNALLFGRCDMRSRGGCHSVEGVYVQPYLPMLRAELHLVHEMVHAWLFLARSKKGYSTCLGGHQDDSLEEVVCNIAAYLYVKKVAEALDEYVYKNGNTSSMYASLDIAAKKENKTISGFLLTKLSRNPINQDDFVRGLRLASTKEGWLRILKDMTETSEF